MIPAIDSLSISKRLKAHKVPIKQAEAIAEELIAVHQVSLDKFATRADLKQIVQESTAELRLAISDVRWDIMKWTVPLILGLYGLLVGLYGLIIFKMFV